MLILNFQSKFPKVSFTNASPGKSFEIQLANALIFLMSIKMYARYTIMHWVTFYSFNNRIFTCKFMNTNFLHCASFGYLGRFVIDSINLKSMQLFVSHNQIYISSESKYSKFSYLKY